MVGLDHGFFRGAAADVGMPRGLAVGSVLRGVTVRGGGGVVYHLCVLSCEVSEERFETSSVPHTENWKEMLGAIEG